MVSCQMSVLVGLLGDVRSHFFGCDAGFVFAPPRAVALWGYMYSTVQDDLYVCMYCMYICMYV